jgi:hypothetical protein
MQDTLDAGAADTVTLECTVIPQAATNQLKLKLELWVFHDGGVPDTLIGVGMGFNWDNPNLQMDSARASSLTDVGFGIGPFLYENDNIPPAPVRQLWASYYFTLSSWSVNDSVLLDTMQFNAGSIYQVVIKGQKTYLPYWTGEKVVHDVDYVPPSNIVLTPDSLYFSAIQGGAPPPVQSFEISSDGNQFDFDLFESISWAIPSPVLGTTPRDVNVLINLIGLTPALYVDSIRVEADDADNSPQYMKLVLEVLEPPPTIGVSPNQFFFNAVAGDTNPDPKTLVIQNVGGSTLNWTVTNETRPGWI